VSWLMEILRQVKLTANDSDSGQFIELIIEVNSQNNDEVLYSCKLISHSDDSVLIEETLSPANKDLDLAEAIFVETMADKLGKGYEEIYDGDFLDEPSISDNYQSCGDVIEEMRQRILYVADSNKSNQLGRLIWRIGELELGELANDVAAYLNSDDEILDYCIAWSLGRLKQAESFKLLEKLNKTSNSEMVRRISLEAMLNLGSAKKKAIIVKKVTKLLPETVQEALRSSEHENAFALVDEHIDSLLKTKGMGAAELFYNLYLVASENKNARLILVRALKSIPLTANFFKAVRLLFKMSEFRLDAEIYGLLTYRLEVTDSPYGKNSWDYEFIRLPHSFEYVSFAQEMEKEDCRLAYSARSREYLRRRSLRFLRKLSKLQPKRYAEFSCYFILPYKDEDGTRARHSKVKDWQPDESGEWQQVIVDEKKYGKFSSYYAFNPILFSKSERYQISPSRRAWVDTLNEGEEDNETFSVDFTALKRLEAYPEHWDEQPDLLLMLLKESECEYVHRFASVALFANKQFCESLTQDCIALLLSSRYTVTAAFSLEVVTHREHNAEELIPTLLNSRYLPAREYGIAKFQEFAAQFKDPEKMFSILSNDYKNVRLQGQKQLSLKPLSQEDSIKLVHYLVDLLLSLGVGSSQSKTLVTAKSVEFDKKYDINQKNKDLKDKSQTDKEKIDDISKVLNSNLSEYLKTVEMKTIEALLHHSFAWVQAVAGEILIHHGVSAEYLPTKVFHALIESKSTKVREVGLKLFQQLPKPVLIKQAEMLASFCLSEHHEIRMAVSVVIKPLVKETPELGVKLVSLLLNQLFLTPRFSGYSDYILQLVKGDLAQSIYQTDNEALWRLLKSPARSIQQLGATLLQKRLASSFEVSQWTQLASHSLYNVRRWAWNVFEENVEQAKSSASESVKLLDSGWEETRQFGMRYFLNYFDEKNWTPDILVRVCDSELKDVQKFGCELVLDFFQEGQGVDYLMKLSQHQSLHVQQFVMNFLDRYAANQNARIEALMPYFRSVFSKLNRGRILKTKIYQFLKQQACKSEQTALLIIPLFNDFLFTCVETDRNKVIEILNELLTLYPNIDSPLKKIQPRVVAAKNLEQDEEGNIYAV